MKEKSQAEESMLKVPVLDRHSMKKASLRWIIGARNRFKRKSQADILSPGNAFWAKGRTTLDVRGMKCLGSLRKSRRSAQLQRR